MRLLFITSNRNKLTEARQILDDITIDSQNLELEEIQGDIREVVERKLDEAYSSLKTPLIVEDTSLIFDSMKSLPGPYIKDFLKNIPLDNFSLLASFDGGAGGAKAVCALGFMDSNGRKHIFRGECLGSIVKPRGKNNFGWDSVFQPYKSEKTFAEMTVFEKNRFSHRKKAFIGLRDFLRKSKTFK